ncbi:MAG: T9SS type A sorting domain-containing protein [Flavobacteriales bacterium]
MNTNVYTLLSVACGFLCSLASFSQCSINAGSDFIACDGEEITFLPIVTDGVEPYSFTYDNGTTSGAGLTTTLSGNPLVNENQDFTITVTDSDGCISSDVVRVDVRSLPDVTVAVTNSTCLESGALEFSFINHPNRSAIEFSINGGASYFSQVLDNSGSVSYPLTPGTYNCFVRWGNNECPVDLGNHTILDLGGVSFDIGGTETICEETEVTLNPLVTGGTAPFTYAWTDGTNSGTGLVFTPEGDPAINVNRTFTVTLTDALGCIAEQQKTYSIRSNPTVTVSTIDADCFTAGAIEFNFPDHPNRTGIEFSINGGSSYSNVQDNSGSLVFNEPPGTYDCIVRWGDNSCPEELGAFTINDLGSVSLELGGTETICENDEVILSPIITGGTGPFNFTWDDGANSGTGIIFTPTGNPDANITRVVTVSLTDANGCIAVDTKTYTIESQPTVTVTTVDQDCFTSSSIEFSFPDHPNRGGIEFSTNGGSSYETSVLDNSGSVTYFESPGVYSCFARWGNNECPVDLGTYTIQNFGGVTMDAGGDQTICENTEITLSPVLTGAVSPFNYTWTDGTNSGTGLTYTPAGDPNVNVTSTFTITLTDGNGCVAQDDIAYSIRSSPTVTNVSTIDGCGTSGGVTFDFSNHPNRTGIEFSLNGGSSYENSISDALGSFTYNLAPGTYTFFSRWGDNSCPINLGTFTINSLPIDLEAGSDFFICEGEEIVISPNVSDGTAPYTYVYTNGVDSGTGLTFTPSGDPTQNVDYSYTLTVTDANGCQDVDDFEVTVRSSPTASVTGGVIACDGSGDVIFTFSDHPNNLGIEFSLNGGVSYESPIPDNTGTVSYNRTEGTYDTYAAFFGNVCPTPVGVVQFINADTYHAVADGNSSDAIWVPDGGTIPLSIEFCSDRNLVIDPTITVTADDLIIANDLTLSSSGRLDMSASNYDLELYGDMTVLNTLTFKEREGKVSFLGSALQSINSNIMKFHDVTVDNSAGVELNSDMEVSGVFKPEAGTFDVNGNDFTLTSDMSGGNVLTGSISEIKSGADFLGEIKIERYVESLEEGYRLIGVPIQGQTVGDFQGQFVTTGYSGSDWPGQAFTNVKWYDETEHYVNNIDSGFVDVTSTGEAIQADKGYWAYFPPSTSNVVLESEGVFNKGDVTFNLGYTETGPDAFEGWHCIPNPYPSAIDIMSADIELVNVDRAIYILDHTLGGTWQGEYVIYNNGVSVNGGSNIVSSYQAFFIKATGPGASITFKEPCKSDDQGAFLRNSSVERPLIRLAMNQGERKYESVIAFDESASEEFDSQFDAYKKNSVMFSLASISNEDTLSINTLQNYEEALEIPIHVFAPYAGEYTLSLDELKHINSNLCLTITDLETNEVYPIDVDLTVPFSTGADNYQGIRFLLSSKPVAQVRTTTPTCALSNDATIQVNTSLEGNYSYTLHNEFEEEILSEETSGNLLFEELYSGIYNIVITDQDGYCGVSEYEVTIADIPLFSNGSVSFIKDHCNAEEGKIFISVSHDQELNAKLYIGDELISELTGQELLTFENLLGGVYEVEVSNECASETHTVDVRNEEMVNPFFSLPEEEILLENSLTLSLVSESENSLLDEWIVDGVEWSTNSSSFFTINEAGVYNITLRSTGSNCVKEFTKSISVSDYIEEVPLEADFVMSVNSSEIDIRRTRGEAEFDLVEIFDVSGKLISTVSVNDTQNTLINHSDLAKGAYILRLSLDGTVVHSQKVSK